MCFDDRSGSVDDRLTWSNNHTTVRSTAAPTSDRVADISILPVEYNGIMDAEKEETLLSTSQFYARHTKKSVLTHPVSKLRC
jgi:hypothetical protein